MIDPGIILRYSYRQYQTDGRLQNLYETLDELKAGLVLLSFADLGFDDKILDSERVAERIAVIKQTVRRLKKRKFHSELVLPGFADCADKDTESYLQQLYVKAVETGVNTIWVDDSEIEQFADVPAIERKHFYQKIAKEVHKVAKKVQLGLIAAAPEKYNAVGCSPLQLAVALADGSEPLLAQSQPFSEDYNRVEMLDAAAAVAISQMQNMHAIDNVSLLGNINQMLASPFNKSAESTQMQLNINMLYGHRQIILNCFDQMGTAPRRDNLYIQMINGSKKYYSKLANFVPADIVYPGIKIILSDEPDAQWNIAAARMLWRMGLPVSFIRVSDIDDNYDSDSVSILTGTTPQEMTREQFDVIFKGGVLLDSAAAQTIFEMGLPGLLGCKMAGPIKDVCTEMLAYQAYANRFYGHQTIFRSSPSADTFRQIEPFHVNTKVITEIIRFGKLGNVDGMVIFDNVEHGHRSAILPYELNEDSCKRLLSPARQRHTQEIIHWLQRKPLPCFVENTPDLVPFMGIVPDTKRIVLTLLNVGFDWAIDSRIRFGKLPFKVKRVKELNEQGAIIKDESLKMCYDNSYSYIQLNSDFAVPPMQMLNLILEG